MGPAVSVVVTVFNGERFLRAAIESLLYQTLRTIEVIVVDDASTDETPQILESLDDPRLLVLTNRENQGPFASARRGLEVARAELVARMDADDVSAPQRLELQREFLRRNPEVGVVGSACRLIGEDGSDLGERRLPREHLEIRWASLFGCPFQHSTVMLRRAALSRESYDPDRRIGGDYDLWSRLLLVTRGANLDEPLVSCRRVSTGTSATRRPEQISAHDQIALRAVNRQFPQFPVTPERLARLRARLDGRGRPGTDDATLAGMMLELFAAFSRREAEEPGLGALEAKVKARAEALRRGEP